MNTKVVQKLGSKSPVKDLRFKNMKNYLYIVC